MSNECISTLEKQFKEVCSIINLKYEYPGYTGDEQYAIVTDLNKDELCKYKQFLAPYVPYIVLSASFSEVRKEFKRNENKYEMRAIRGCHFSLDDYCNSQNLEVATKDCLEQFLAVEQNRELYEAMGELNEVQKRRIIAYFFEGLTYRQIANIEGVDHTSVMESIKRSLKKMENYLGLPHQNTFPGGNK